MKKIFIILAVALVLTGCLSSQTLPNGKKVPRNKQIITFTYYPSKIYDSPEFFQGTSEVEYEFDIDFKSVFKPL